MKLLLTIILLLLLPLIVSEGDETQINDLLKAGGTVTLENRVYEITGPLIIHSNTMLKGGSNTIIKVSSSSSQWFTGSNGIISYKESLKNVEIYNSTVSLPFIKRLISLI